MSSTLTTIPTWGEVTARFVERANPEMEVTTVTDAETGLSRLDEGFDCVVSDYRMPGMDGLEFLEAVRDTYPDLPFVLFTGQGSEEIASEAISAGVTDYLQKGQGTEQYELLANRIERAVSRYRAERDLERSEERYRALVDASPVAIVLYDSAGEIQYVNGATLDLVGAEEEAEVVGEGALDFVHPEIRERHRERMRRILEEGETLDPVESRIVGVDGEIRNVTITGAPVTFDGEAAVQVVLNDITEQKERERELERYETILAAAGDAMYTLNDEGVITYVNDRFEDLTGYEADEAVGEHVSLFLSEFDIERGTELIRLLLERDDRDRATIEMEIHPREGDPVPCEINVALLPSGEEFRGTSGVIRDVTARKERERELELYGAIVETMSEAAYVLGPENRFEFVNRRAAERMGLASEDLTGEPVDFLAEQGHLGAEQVELLSEGIERLRSEDVSTVEYELEPDREVTAVAVRMRAVSLLGESRVLLTSRDVSERKERERELQRQNERLDGFASIVSHDLRNPLNVAVGKLDAAPVEHESIEEAKDAMFRMSELIDDLLDLARQGRDVDDPEPVDLALLARRAWSTTEGDGQLELADDLGQVLADESRVRQLFENLFVNAMEHASGDVQTSLSEPGSADVRVEVARLPDGFYVADDGPGIPAEERDAVFDPGYTTDREGTGLGLAIVRDVAAAHGWEIDLAESRTGGARFEFRGVERP